MTTFLEMHVPGSPLLMPNPWDVGSARILASLGFRALATTSNGQAASLGRPDGSLIPDEVLAHARRLVQTVDVPISVDLEDGFAAEPSGVRAVVFQASRTGVAGVSIEDWSADGIRPLPEAVERMQAAVSAAEGRVVLTGRAENFFRGNPDLDDTITRLQAYQEAGADVLYAPGLSTLDEVRAVVSSVDRPVSVLARPGLPSVASLAEAGVARISVGGAFAQAAYGALARAARELQDEGTFGYTSLSAEGRDLYSAFS
ncbi:isocitrate lyase/PEP mutase family protein [Pseudonocardia endophytica]|uniref:2-methylisocitrate lyase-like PEP mutase family enzyme n=1 Tax=Pseudonocardia endophytica TaxID=401976 RepID=A0A4R1HEI9_PSEEN|nr:isocitrate lyase/phosphoenolpyruvate mutase family protein [Pseudonocardia endophytica]TCK20018.1 2-methylisocitrate lyase-like PEP mutase family enzyme [Pseudonocardia endophytica]